MSILRAVVYGRGWRTLDATGRDVPLYDHLDHAGDADPPIDHATFQAVRRDANSLRAGNWDSGPKWGVVILACWFVVAGTVKLVQKPGIGNVIGVVVWGGVIALIVWAWQKLIHASPRQFVRCMLGRGHCPSCGYAMMAKEGATATCPECGAVWHVTPLRPLPPSPCTSPVPSQDQHR